MYSRKGEKIQHSYDLSSPRGRVYFLYGGKHNVNTDPEFSSSSLSSCLAGEAQGASPEISPCIYRAQVGDVSERGEVLGCRLITETGHLRL